jgi:hypothetical protein
MSKPLVFISHISEEKELAIAFKDLIESSFLGMIDLFVSSDHSSVQLGQKWLDNITEALGSCVVEIVICSSKSVVRPWINFEAGAGWIRNIPVIPLCHSGMKPSSLPLPLNLLQAATATEVSSLKLILPVLGQAIGSKTPSVDFTDFISKVIDFESTYTFWDECNVAFKELHNINDQIIPALRQGKTITIDLTETQINQLGHFMPFLQQHNILQFQRSGSSKFTNIGTFYGCNLIPMSDLHQVINDKRFKH